MLGLSASFRINFDSKEVNVCSPYKNSEASKERVSRRISPLINGAKTE